MTVRLLHLADLHFGAHVHLDQISALERLAGELAPTAVVIAGDVTQRARHGEFQRALAFVETLRRARPVLVVAGNHDTAWWRSPLGLLGAEPRYRKFRRYLGELDPVLEVPGAVIAGALTAHGLAFGSFTWNLRDLTVKGHLPRGEVERASARFGGGAGAAGPGVLRVVVLHHNVLRGRISARMGLARWRQAQRRLARSGAELVLCGHDHEESVGELDGGVVVAAAGTPTSMTRGKRPPAVNVITADDGSLSVRHYVWDGAAFAPGDEFRFPRQRPGVSHLLA